MANSWLIMTNKVMNIMNNDDIMVDPAQHFLQATVSSTIGGD